MGKAVADTGNDSAGQETRGAEISSDPAAQPAESDTVVDSRAGDTDGRTEDQTIPAAPRIPLHPLAQVFPIGGEESVRELARHISQGVPVDPVILFEGKVLDRRELYLACLEAGREPTFETYTGNDPLGFLIDRQLHRGYPTESQRGMLAARACDFLVGGNQYSQGLSIGRASELVNVSPETISRAKKVLARGIPELVKAVDDGTLKVSKAYTIAKKQPQQQREELDRLLAAASAVGRTSALEIHNPPGSGDTSQQVQGGPAVADADGAVGPELPETARGEDQSHAASTSTAAPGAPSSASAASAESSPRAPYYSSDEWIWPGYIPTPGVTAIVGGIKAATTLVAIKVAATVASGGAWPDRTCAASGEVTWLTAQHGRHGSTTTMALRDRLAAAGATFDLIGYESVHIVEPEPDDCGLPIHHLSRDLHRLQGKLLDTHKVSVAVIDYLSPYVGEDIDQAIRGFRGAFSALKDFATKFGIAIILPCRLPCHGASSVIARAIDALRPIADLHSVFLVEGANPGTLVLAKGSAVAKHVFGFRLRKKPAPWQGSTSAVVWENSILTKSATRHEPYTTESLANREIANTSDPEVSDKSSSAGVVPPQSDEIPAPSEPSPPPGAASPNSTEGAAASRGSSPQTLRAGASANIGKPEPNTLSRKPTVPVRPSYSKPTGGRPAPFSSAAAEDGDKKGRGLAKSAFGGNLSTGLRQRVPTKPSTKVRKLGKRKVPKMKVTRPSRDDPSDWC